MPKISKKSSAASVVPITHFFSRKACIENRFSSPSDSQLPSTQSENSKPRNTSASRNRGMSGSFTPSASIIPVSPSPASTSTDRKILDAVEIIRTPNNKISTRPKSVFDSDSDGELPAPPVYVLRSPSATPSTTFNRGSFLPPLRATENLTNASQTRTRPKKIQRLLSPTPGSESIPTSQPDERDIAPNHSRGQAPRPGRKRLSSAILTDALLTELHEGPRSNFDMTPPPMEDTLPTPSPHISPSPLSPDSKTAQIIANIKRRAYATSLNNRPETPVREFRDQLSDGSDDDLLPVSPVHIKSTKKHSLPTTNKCSSTRYNLRSQVSMSPPSTEKRPVSPSSNHMLVASPVPPAYTKTQRKERTKNFNPIDDLLKEKKQLDALGKGLKALLQAEATLADRDVLMLDVGGEDFTNEDVAKKSIMEYRQKALKSSSPTAIHESEDEVKDEERERLLGEKHAKEVSRLLESDNANKEREKTIKKVAGTSFWLVNEDTGSLMDLNEIVSPVPPTSSSQLAALQNAFERQDLAQATLLINLGFDYINPTDYDSIIPYFCKLALSLNETMLSRSAHRYLIRVWEMPINPMPGITLACVLSTLAQLGAQPSVFHGMGWMVNAKQVVISSENRHAVLYRLVALVSASAQSHRTLKEEIPDILMSLILIANESSTPPDLQYDVVLATNELCSSLAPREYISNYESMICTKVLKYASTLEPVNKAYIAALFGSGIGRTRRISRWIAHGIITDRQTLASEDYSELPPLTPLVEELTCRRSGRVNQSYGKFEQHAKTDFADMMSYVEILSIAVTNIERYAVAERKTSTSSVAQHTDAPEPPLKAMRLAIEILHSEISDIRATHLDRSRTKAALKQFSLRLHYQRHAALHDSGTLHTYFAKKPRGSLS